MRMIDLSTLSAGILLCVFSAAHATNGYSPTGFGVASKGLAGAGVAFPQDTLAGATNPAGMVFVGDRVDVGVALFGPDRGFTADDNAVVKQPVHKIDQSAIGCTDCLIGTCDLHFKRHSALPKDHLARQSDKRAKAL